MQLKYPRIIMFNVNFPTQEVHDYSLSVLGASEWQAS